MIISKANLDRLGNKIRDEKENITEETLNQLQEYRTSYKDVLSQTFNVLCSNSRKIHKSAIVTYRIKRFESIIGKLQRFPEMRFSRMWDIGGCRCVLRNNNEVYKLRDLISLESEFEIVKEKDYIQIPQEDGYKSLHLFLKFKSSDKVIEVQLRSQKDHNWATLVEITDVLFDSKLKELSNDKDLLRFHLLLSQIDNLELENKKEIAQILKKYNYFEKLSEVFSRNYIKVRRQWFDIESKNNHKFFLIETTKNEVPKIESFKSSVEAEESYFNVYKSRQNANIVLTHLQTPNYKQVSIAYSNYILTFHSFLDECYEILESLIIESLRQGAYFEYFTIYNLYNNLVFHHIKNMVHEVKEINAYTQELRKNNSKKKRNKSKEKEWINDFRKQLDSNRVRGKKLGKKLRNKFQSNMPNNKIRQFIVNKITSLITYKYKRKIESMFPVSGQ